MAEAKKEKAAEVDLSALKEQLKKELLKELEEARAAEGTKGNAPQSEAERAQAAWLEEYVSVQLFKDGKDYKDDVFVSVNGENCHIKRGVPVRIKRKFALVLEQSQAQDVSAAEYAEQRQREFSDTAKHFNI